MHFKSKEEFSDVVQLLKNERDSGAQSGGIFGSRLGKCWSNNSDIDIVINTHGVGDYGEIEHIQGRKSRTWLHVFRKKPGKLIGGSKYEEILNIADSRSRKLFNNR